MPTSDTEARALREWAVAADDRPEPATEQEIARQLAAMSATMPSKVSNQNTATLRAAVYSKLLANYSNDALAFLAREAITTLKWFPTISECRDILQTYRAPPSDKERALALASRYWSRSYEHFQQQLSDGLGTQEIVDTAPRQWQMIAMERGYLRHMPDTDTFIIRRRAAIEDQSNEVS